jgi:hypothetical protein
VRDAYAAVFAQYPDAHWGGARHLVRGDRGVSEWTFTGTLKDGKRVEVNGCDLFTFRSGKIAVKNSFRKNRPAIGWRRIPCERYWPLSRLYSQLQVVRDFNGTTCRPRMRCPKLSRG